MEDPKYTASVSIGGAENNTTDYETDCMGDRIHADQSFILQYTLTDGNDAGAFDIATATATLYVTAYKNAEFTPVSLAGGVLTDSGSGTTDRVTFTVAKDLIPDELAAFPLRTPGNAVFYAIISDADSKIEIVNFVNVYDDSYGLTSEAQPGANTIVPKGNDLGTVTDYTVTTPPTPTLNLAYIVAPSATGDWAGEDNNLAIGNGTSWIFFTVLDGNFAFDDNSDNQILFDGTSWAETSTQPFTDATALVKNDADNTKLIGFDASAITTATTRTITMPDTAVDLGDIATNTAKVTNATHTGDATGATALTLATVNGNVGSFTNADVTVNAKGLITAVSNGSGGAGDMAAATYDPATIAEQLVGLVATQTLTNKTVNGVVLNAAGASTAFLNETGAYSTPAGGGDFVGPASSTDNAIMRFDGVTGKLGQNSGILIDGSDNMSGVNSATLTEISAPSTPASGELALYADSTTSLPMAKNDAGTEMQLSNGVYKTITFNAGGMTPRTTNGATSGTQELPTNDINLDYFDFDAATDEAVQVAFMMPDDWDLSTVKFKFIWTDATTAGTGTVVWAVRAVATSNDDALDAAWGTPKGVSDAFIASGDNHTSSATTALTIGGTPALGDLVVFEFYRDADNGGDTYTQDARLLNVTMQYKTLDTTTAAW